MPSQNSAQIHFGGVLVFISMDITNIHMVETLRECISCIATE